MELEFDKEIDALMRERRFADRGVLVGDTPKVHLDADELAAFAENAMPDKTRALYMRHLADCDQCRKILANVITLNAEAEPQKAAAVAAKAVVSDLPWYRRLFLFPNLAYLMGGLVLVFSGILAVSVLQTSNREAATSVSQVTDNETGHGPMAMEEPNYSAAANTANASANTNASSIAPVPYPASNSMTNAAAANSTTLAKTEREASPADSAASGVTLDGVSSSDTKQPAASAAAPPPVLAEAPKAGDDEMKRAAAKEEDKARLKDATENEKTDLALKAKKAENVARNQAGGPAKPVPGPSRDMQQNFPNRADNTYELRSRRVAGKDFQYKNGVWYDNAYHGQATTNVRRGTEDYRKLDSGLRSIAESLSGVVVAVWKDRAYRVQ